MRAMTVNECLSFAQNVPRQPGSRAAVAITWRNCQSFPCSNTTCAERIRTELRGLTDAFLTSRPEYGSAIRPKPPSAEPNSLATVALPPTGGSPLSLAAIYYLLYVITCIAVVI